MSIERRAVALLRLFLVALFGILVVLETLSLPGQFRYMAQENPEDAHLRWPLTIITIFWVVCVQVVIVSTWKLLTLVQQDRIFSDDSRRWVDAIVWAIAAAWVTFSAFTGVVLLNADDPGVPLILILMSLTIGAAGLLMIVLRALLRRATTLRADLDEVI